MNNQFVIDREFQKLIPSLTEEEFNQLENNIIKDGCRDSLVVWNGILIDGHNRYKICTENNIEFKTDQMNFQDRQAVIEWIILNQFGRRNLSNFQRSELALRLKPIIQEKAKERQIRKPSDSVTQKSAEQKPKRNESRDELAKIAGVSHDTIEKVESIKKNGSDEQLQRVREGGKGNSINAIYHEIKNQETKVCSKCGEEKPLSEFYKGKGQCRECLNAYKRERSITDFKGNTIEVNAEVAEKARLYSDKIEKDLYDTQRNFDYTVDDMEEEINSLIDYFDRNIKDILETRKSVVNSTENKQKIKAVLNEAEAAIKTIKELFLHE